MKFLDSESEIIDRCGRDSITELGELTVMAYSESERRMIYKLDSLKFIHAFPHKLMWCARRRY